MLVLTVHRAPFWSSWTRQRIFLSERLIFILRPTSQDTFLRTILRYCYKKILIILRHRFLFFFFFFLLHPSDPPDRVSLSVDCTGLPGKRANLCTNPLVFKLAITILQDSTTDAFYCNVHIYCTHYLTSETALGSILLVKWHLLFATSPFL